VKTIEKSKTIVDLSIYGDIPDRPLHLSVKPLTENSTFMGRIARMILSEMDIDFGKGSTKLPLISIIPKDSLPHPSIILIGSREELDRYAEKWIDEGYCIFFIDHKDISENNGNFKSGISAYISPSRRKKSSAGKLAVWVWATLRVLEYAEVLDYIDKDKIGVAGRGIFALSAMLAYSYSGKFSFVIADEMPQINKDFLLKNSHLFAPRALN
jgi:hypothetical protein